MCILFPVIMVDEIELIVEVRTYGKQTKCRA